MQASRSTAAIILAAGSSSRMGKGRHKLLLPLADRPVLAHVLGAAIASQAHPLILVMGHAAGKILPAIVPYITSPAINIVNNPDYLQGMSTSMHTGLHVLMRMKWVESAVIMLGDQPFITPQIIDSLISTRQKTGKQIVAPLYEGKRGNPTLFAASLFPELLKVTGDEGGRSVLERHQQELATVELGDAMANYDVDTWEAYQQAVEAWRKKNM